MNFLHKFKFNNLWNKKILFALALVGLFVISSFSIALFSGFETDVSATVSPFLPDLEASHASVAEGDPVPAHSEVIFDFKVTNISEADAPEHSITCYIDGEEFDSGFNGNALEPGEEDWSWCQIDDVGPPGDYEFKICVDEEDAVEETDNGNNCDFVEFEVVSSGTTPPPPATGACESANGSSLSVSEFKEAMDDGLISFNLVTDESSGKSTFTIENDTNCTAPISLASYQMFKPQPDLSSQKFFDGTGLVNVGTSATLEVDLPNCAAQVDAWYGLHPQNLLASNPYEFPFDVPSVLGFHFTSGDLCKASPPPPPPPPSAPSCVLEVDRSPIFRRAAGGSTSTFLSWSTNNATSASIDKGIGSVNPIPGGATVAIQPLTTTTYTMTVSGPGGTATCNDTVTVLHVPASCTFSASPSSIDDGESATLNWTTENVASATINEGIGAVPVSGSQIVSPSSSKTYVLSITGIDGSKTLCTADVTVDSVPPPPPAPSCTFSANPSVVILGGSSTLNWTTENANSVSINQGIGGVALDGSTSVNPGSTKTYTLTAENSEGVTAICGATVTVSSTPLADVSIEKSVNDTSLQKGGFFTYTLNYENSGNLTANNVTINDTPSPTGILSGFTLVSGPSHGSCSAKTNGIECNLGTLNPGASGTIVYRATGENVGNTTNTAVIDTTTSETTTSNNQDSVSISVTSPPGGGGCTVNCGGGLNQPNVVLFQSPGDDTLASQSFIFLSQVPYTGIVGNFKTMFILTLLALLSIYISYVLIEKRVAHRIFSVIFNGGFKTEPGMGNFPYEEESTEVNQDYEIYATALATAGLSSRSQIEEKDYLRKVVSPEKRMEETKPAPAKSFGSEAREEDNKGLTQIAKTQEALMSDDALRLIGIVSEIKGTKKEAVLTDLIEHAKKNYPKEDGYLIIDSDRAENILFSIETNIVQTFVLWLSEGKDKKALDFLRLLRNNDISIENFMKRVVYYIDNFYRCHIGEMVDENHRGVDFHAHEYCWNKDDLQEIVSVLVNGVDESYKSQDASIKLALIKVTEITKRAQTRKSYYSV